MTAIPDRVAAVQRRIRVALAQHPADLVLRNAKVVSPHALLVHTADVVILGDRIVAVREGYEGEARSDVDCSGLYALPGLIEPHLFAPPRGRWAEAIWSAVSNGTTTLFSTEFGGGAGVARLDLPGRLFEPTAAGLVRRGGPNGVEEETATGFVPAPHGPGLAFAEGADVVASLRQGRTVVVSDTTPWTGGGTVLDRVAAGALDGRHLCLGRPDGQVHLGLVAALRAGIDPGTAVQLAGLNAATHYGVEHEIGSVTPGRLADVVLLHELDRFPPERVYVGGELVARSGCRP